MRVRRRRVRGRSRMPRLSPTPDTVQSSDDADDSEAVQDATPSNTVAAATPPDLATETICGYPIFYHRVALATPRRGMTFLG